MQRGKITKSIKAENHLNLRTIVQINLEKHTAAGAVLMASTPPSGVVQTTLNIAQKYSLTFLKANFSLSLYPMVDSPDRIQNLFFTSEISEEALKSYHKKMQDELFLAFLDMLVLDLPKVQERNIPMLVIGSKSDAVINPKVVRKTATAYGTEPVFLEGLNHDMMLGPRWKVAVDCILGGWLHQVHSC